VGFFEKVYSEIRMYLAKFNVYEIVTDLSEFEKVASGQIIISINSKKVDELNCKIKKDFKEENLVLTKNLFIKDILNLQDRKDINYDFKDVVFLSKISNITCGLEYGALRDLFISDSKLNNNYHKVINGAKGVPERYNLVWGGKYVLFDKEYEKKIIDENKNISKTGKVVHLISGNESKYRRPKLFIRQSAMKLVATYDNEDYYGLRSLFILNLKSSDYSIKYILAVLNSKLMTQYVLSKGLIRYAKGKQPQIRIA